MMTYMVEEKILFSCDARLVLTAAWMDFCLMMKPATGITLSGSAALLLPTSWRHSAERAHGD